MLIRTNTCTITTWICLICFTLMSAGPQAALAQGPATHTAQATRTRAVPPQTERTPATRTRLIPAQMDQGTPGQQPNQDEQPSLPFLPPVGERVGLSQPRTPPVVKGIKIYPQEPLRFDFIIDTGQARADDPALSDEATKMVKYFLAGLTVPGEDLWVNLSPQEKDRIIPEAFGYTEMGRDLLAQDYLLKQITASLIYPEGALGQAFWDEVYARVDAQYGPAGIPVDTFNKVWIMPRKAVVYENGPLAFVESCCLKVMLEAEYLKTKGTGRKTKDESSDISRLTSEAVKNIIIPAIEKEVNTGARFTKLRQIYHSLILATWFKKKLMAGIAAPSSGTPGAAGTRTAPNAASGAGNPEHILCRCYLNQNRVMGVDIPDKDIKQKIYSQYIAAFKQGVFDYIKEEYDPASQTIIPRKYFSGGMAFNVDSAMVTRSVSRGQITKHEFEQRFIEQTIGSLVVAGTSLTPRTSDPELITRLNQAGVQDNSGLIGKYRLTSDVEVDEAKGEIRFTGVNIETPEEEAGEEAITLKIAEIRNTRDALPELWQYAQQYAVLTGIVEWFNKNFSRYYVIEENAYGIHGLGRENAAAVSERFKDSGLVLLHEAAEAMGDAGRLHAQNILPLIKDTDWFYGHINKPGRRGMDLHYALRALMREINAQADRTLTLEIQGRFTTREIQEVAEQESPGLNTVPVIQDFQELRRTARTRAEEEVILKELISKHAALQAQQQKEEARKAEELRRRTEQEHKERTAIRSILKTASKIHNDYNIPMHTRDNQVRETLKALYVLRPEWVASEVAAFLESNNSFPATFFNSVLLESFALENPRNIPALALELYKDLFKPGTGITQRNNIFKQLTTLLPHAGYLPAEDLLPLYDRISKDFRSTFRQRPAVLRHQVMLIPHHMDFFEADPDNKDRLYFKEDFESVLRGNDRLRNEKMLQYLETLYEQAMFPRVTLTELFKTVLRKDRTATLTNLTLAYVTGNEFRTLDEKIHAMEALVLVKNLLLRPETKARVVNTLFDLLKDTTQASQRRNIYGQLGRLIKSGMPLATKESTADTLWAQLEHLRTRIDINTRAFQEIERAVENLDTIPDEDIKKMLLEDKQVQRRNAAKHQEKLMGQMEDILELLTDLIDTGSQGETLAFENRLIDDLEALSADESVDVNIRAEVISRFRNLFIQGHERITRYFQRSLLMPQEPALRAAVDLLLATPAAGITEDDLTPVLAEGGLPERLGLLLILKADERQELLEAVIRDQRVPAGLRLYAFSWYAADTPDLGQLNPFLEMLRDDALAFLKERARDHAAARAMVDDILLQDDAAQMYMTALLTVAQNELVPVSGKNFALIATSITQAKILAYYENANHRLNFGGKMLDRAGHPAAFFFQMMGHEHTHNILHEEYNYESFTLNKNITHELLADLMVFALSDLAGLDKEDFKRALRYTDEFLRVVDDDYHSVEAHEGARAQLTELEAFFAERGEAVDPLAMLKTALRLLENPEKHNLPAKEMTKSMIRHYLQPGLFDTARDEGSDDLSNNFLASLNNAQKEALGIPVTEPEKRREPILRKEEITAFLEASGDYAMTAGAANRGTSNVGGIDLNPAAMELETTGHSAGFTFPLKTLNTIEPAKINGFSPVIFNLTPVRTIAVFK